MPAEQHGRDPSKVVYAQDALAPSHGQRQLGNYKEPGAAPTINEDIKHSSEQVGIQAQLPQSSCMELSAFTGTVEDSDKPLADMLGLDPASGVQADFLNRLVRRQVACVGFMKDLSAMLQPTDACRAGLVLSASRVENSVLQGPGSLLVEDLGELVSTAKGAVAAMVASCQQSASELQAKLLERDRLVQTLQQQVGAGP